jgi:hypothetical protein
MWIGKSPSQFRELLRDEGYRKRVVQYLETVVKLDFDWTPYPQEIEIRGLNKWEHPSFQWPPYGKATSTTTEWQSDFNRDAKAIATTVQTHRHTATCRKKGTVCRFGYAGEGKDLVAETTADVEQGTIDLKRGNSHANNHNPSLASVTRSNHDIKPTFTSGYQCLSSLYYMTTYMSKFEDDTSDLVAMDAAWRDLTKEGVLSSVNSRDRLRRLAIRMNYLRNTGQQFSGAQVAAMLLAIGTEGTQYTSSKYAIVNLYTFINYARYSKVDFKVRIRNKDIRGNEDDVDEDVTGDDCDDDMSEEIVEHGWSRDVGDCDERQETDDVEVEDRDERQDGDDIEVVHGDETSEARAVSNYIWRGDNCEDMSLYDMTMYTEVEKMTAAKLRTYIERQQQQRKSVGRPWNERSLLRPQHPRWKSEWIIFRAQQHTPVLISKYMYKFTETDASRS